MIGSLASNSIVTVTGLSKPSDTAMNQKSWTTNVKYTEIKCYIEQINAKNTLMFQGDVSAKLFQLFTDGNYNISEGDKITDNHGRTFTVNAIQSFVGDTDISDHMEIQMIQKYPS